MPSYYDKDTAVSILFRLNFKGMGSELDEHMRTAGGKKAVGIVEKEAWEAHDCDAQPALNLEKQCG